MKGQRQTALQLDSDRPAAQDIFEAHPQPSAHIPRSITSHHANRNHLLRSRAPRPRPGIRPRPHPCQRRRPKRWVSSMRRALTVPAHAQRGRASLLREGPDRAREVRRKPLGHHKQVLTQDASWQSDRTPRTPSQSWISTPSRPTPMAMSLRGERIGRRRGQSTKASAD